MPQLLDQPAHEHTQSADDNILESAFLHLRPGKSLAACCLAWQPAMISKRHERQHSHELAAGKAVRMGRVRSLRCMAERS